jgi:hypothetical protein
MLVKIIFGLLFSQVLLAGGDLKLLEEIKKNCRQEVIEKSSFIFDKSLAEIAPRI